MPDISMCNKEDCPSFATCYRAQAEPNPRGQKYQNYNNNGKEYCEHYIQIEDNE